jgi:signal transduction histidine kinase
MKTPLKDFLKEIQERSLEKISGVSNEAIKAELEERSSRYHITGAWVATIFNPIFAITDYINIPEHWMELLMIRLSISMITLATLSGQKRFGWASHSIVSVPFMLISLQNCFTYYLIDNTVLLGQNLNYIALLLGAGLFVLWNWGYSLVIVTVSAVALTLSIWCNPVLEVSRFFVEGGLLLIAMALFMIIMIQSRFNLTIREIKARLALNASNEEIRAQAEEIKGINENLEVIVKDRTADLQRKNKALEDYAFINAHKLRGPVASILGLLNLLNRVELNEEAKVIRDHLAESTVKLDTIIGSITEVIEDAEKKI